MIFEKMFNHYLEVIVDEIPDFGDKKWGYGFMLHPETKFGRNMGSASWSGIFDTHFGLTQIQNYLRSQVFHIMEKLLNILLVLKLRFTIPERSEYLYPKIWFPQSKMGIF